MAPEDTPSAAVVAIRASTVVRIWRVLWKCFPGFSRKWSALYFFPDGTVVHPSGFGFLILLKGNKSLQIGWGLDQGPPLSANVFLSQVRKWDAPHDADDITAEEREMIRAKLQEYYSAHNERVHFV